MKSTVKSACLLSSLALILAGCATGNPPFAIDTQSAKPGTAVTVQGEPRQLLGTPLQIGDSIPATALTDAFTMKRVDLSQLKGLVLLISLVPSIDTKVCESQTHYLGEKGRGLSENIRRITISRDTPFAQKRFAEEAKLTDIMFLSDYRDGSFGKSTGLLLEDSLLLARSLIIVDRAGIVRFIQVVPNLAHLPDLESAFVKAETLVKH